MAQDPEPVKTPEEELVEVKAELQATKDTLATKTTELSVAVDKNAMAVYERNLAQEQASTLKSRYSDYEQLQQRVIAAEQAKALALLEAAKVAPIQADLTKAEAERDAERLKTHEAIIDGILNLTERDSAMQKVSKLEVAAAKLIEAFINDEPLGAHLVALTALLPEHGTLDPQVIVKVTPPPEPEDQRTIDERWREEK